MCFFAVRLVKFHVQGFPERSETRNQVKEFLLAESGEESVGIGPAGVSTPQVVTPTTTATATAATPATATATRLLSLAHAFHSLADPFQRDRAGEVQAKIARHPFQERTGPSLFVRVNHPVPIGVQSTQEVQRATPARSTTGCTTTTTTTTTSWRLGQKGIIHGHDKHSNKEQKHLGGSNQESHFHWS